MNIIAYRLPDDSTPHYLTLNNPTAFTSPVSSAGVVIAPFDPNAPKLFYPIEDHISSIPSNILSLNNRIFKFKEMDKEEYAQYIADIQLWIGRNTEKKIVASRRKTLSCSPACDVLFMELCCLYPNAFIFFISTLEFGTWIGASPELLFKVQSQEFECMSLAGTRSYSLNKKQWDKKNILEQRIVTDFIIQNLKGNGVKQFSETSTTLKAANVEHIMTKISGVIPSSFNLLSMLSQLSPTPALAGMPRKEAIEIIQRHEGDRGLYGGFIGLVEPSGDCNLYVMIRCACLSSGTATIFTGGGITAFSNFEEEWCETEQKSQPLEILLSKII